MAARGWSAADVERWVSPGAWEGPGAVETLAEVRKASSRLAASWGLEVDEVVTFFWEALQAPSLESATNKAAYVWRSVSQQVSTHAAGRDLLQGAREASVLKRDISNGVDDVESAVRSVRAVDRQRDVVRVPYRVGDDDVLTAIPANVPVDEPVLAVETVVAVLVDAGWGEGRARRLVDTLVAQAEAISANGVHGFAAIANRLRRREGGAGRGGVSREVWLAAIRLVFGSRRHAPGVLPRVLGGECPTQVRQCPEVVAVAFKVTGRKVAAVRNVA